MTRELMVYILACGFTFLIGIGVGAAITDMIWRMKEGADNDGRKSGGNTEKRTGD